MSTTRTTTTTPSASQTGSGHSPCGCQEQPPAQACCCNLVCFDRPNYFCGHLLTDSDLTLQQKYVVEKNKLYHRTMDGYGVVCGLKLTCDCDCKGHILIHDGFAIDDCGNDLVVCETTRFDVIEALKRKGLLVCDPPEDDCEPWQRKSRCNIKQCFYVTICYDETESDYETPFQSSCTSGPKQCMPTRTHEGVRFDVTRELPPRHSYLDDLEKRIKECFEVHCESPVGVIMKRHVKQLQYIVGAEWGDAEKREEWCDPCELFCTMRAYFLNYLKTKPDQFNCNLFDEVSCLTCPRECREDYDEDRHEHHEKDRRGRRYEKREERLEQAREREGERLLEEEWRLRYREELREAFRKLLYYMERYQYDCVFGDLIFSCQQPCEAHCLVLGTVEVLNGKLVRVCNTPRKYLWAPANLLQVLIYSIMTGRLAYGEDCEDKKVPCCPDYRKFEPTIFLREFEISECGRQFAARSALESARAFAEAVQCASDFTDSMALSPTLLEKLPQALKEGHEFLGIHTSPSREVSAKDLSSPTPWQAFLTKSLVRRGDSVVAYTSPEGVSMLPDFLSAISPDRSVGREIEQKLKLAEEKATENAQQMHELRTEITELKNIVERLEDQKKGKNPSSRR